MPYLDRDQFIGLLNQLGADGDADALAAAREIDRRVKASGAGWDALLSPPPGQAPPGRAETTTRPHRPPCARWRPARLPPTWP
jgi:hypothetical protein